MALSTDLMGLGLPPLLAQALGCDGQFTPTPAGSSFATATRLKNSQEIVTTGAADGTKAFALPAVGSNDGALLGEPFVISNTGTTSLQIYGSSGVTITFNGSAHSQQPVQAGVAAMFWAVSTTSWIGLKGSA